MTTPLGVLEIGSRSGRAVAVTRRTRETEVEVRLDLDGAGRASVATGVGFYDHLLTAFAHHALFDLWVLMDLHVPSFNFCTKAWIIPTHSGRV